MAYQSFEKLEVWKRACRLAADVSHALRESKQFALRDQMQRAAISIPSNIAKDSAAELRTQSYIAEKLDLTTKTDADEFIQETRELSAMLQGLIRSFEKTEN